MIDIEEFVLCEHDRDPIECPECAPIQRERPYADVQQWAEAYASEVQVPAAALVGVPFS